MLILIYKPLFDAQIWVKDFFKNSIPLGMEGPWENGNHLSLLCVLSYDVDSTEFYCVPTFSFTCKYFQDIYAS